MADTGKIATKGYGAGALKYVVLRGYNPNPSGAASLDDVLAELVVINDTLKSLRPLLEYMAFKHQ